VPGFFYSAVDAVSVWTYVSDMKEIARYSGCFVCGEKNAHGIKARFFWDGETATTETMACEQFEGYKGIYHGGVLATLLDEVMIKAILASGHYAVTAEITVRYVAPIRTGDKFVCRGKIVERRGRLFSGTAEAVGADGTVFAKAAGKFVEAKADLRDELLNSINRE
jgi:uncharacterized protein (TIGR00369 family)